MPFTRISEDSALLTTAGWCKAGSAAKDIKCFGADRHGRLAAASVTTCSTDERAREAFVGTSSAFAAFLGETPLMLSDGRTMQLGKLIKSGVVAELSFETLLHLPAAVPLVLRSEEVWEVLGSEAAFLSGNRMALRCHEPRTLQKGFPRIVNDGAQTYCVLLYDDLADRVATKSTETICELGTQWLRNSDEAREEIERGASFFACLLLASRVHLEKWYRLRYDSLQHSSFVFVCDSSTKPAPVARGECAFFGQAMKQVVTISWEEKTWSPLSGGFLVAAN
jgi:hypothetical protein